MFWDPQDVSLLQPSRRNRHEDEEESKLIIAVDFGTTYSGIAYAHSSVNLSQTISCKPEQLRDKIVGVKRWPNAHQYYSEKTPTIIAYENGKPIAWGGRVKPSHLTQISYFKLGLQEGAIQRLSLLSRSEGESSLGGFPTDSSWRHPNLPLKSSVDFVADYLKELRQYLLNEILPKDFGKEFLARQGYRYVLTVPAMWSDKATALTKSAALRAGFREEELELVTEPEAAALYCSTLCQEVSMVNGDRFLICDAGGGTVVLNPRVLKFINSLGSDILRDHNETAIPHQRVYCCDRFCMWCNFPQPRL